MRTLSASSRRKKRRKTKHRGTQPNNHPLKRGPNAQKCETLVLQRALERVHGITTNPGVTRTAHQPEVRETNGHEAAPHTWCGARRRRLCPSACALSPSSAARFRRHLGRTLAYSHVLPLSPKRAFSSGASGGTACTFVRITSLGYAAKTARPSFIATVSDHHGDDASYSSFQFLHEFERVPHK